MKEGSMMKRSFTAIPDMKSVKAATGPYGNEINVNIEALKDLRGYLRLAFDSLEEMDDETFQAIGDGEQLSYDLDAYLRELDITINMLKEMEK